MEMEMLLEKLLCGEQLLICNNGMYSDTETAECSVRVMHDKREEKDPRVMQGNDCSLCVRCKCLWFIEWA